MNHDPLNPRAEVPPVRLPEPAAKRGMNTTGIVLAAIIIAGIIIIMPVLLLLPAIGHSREAARRNSCMSHMRQLSTGVRIHENVYRRYPSASDGTTDLLRGQVAADHGNIPAATNDGFSWLYQMLPFIEEKVIAKEMGETLKKNPDLTGPFDSRFVNSAAQPYASLRMANFRCPTYSGDTTTKLGGVDAAVANYCAIVGTGTAERSAAPWKRTNWEDGAMPSACWKTHDSQTQALKYGTCKGKGMTEKSLTDGISKTIIACESRETIYNAWISGACMWVMATSPNSLAADNVSLQQGRDSFVEVAGSHGKLGEGLALNFGSWDPSVTAAEKYLQASDWATNADRMWGPSSEHSGNIVMHVWADVHAKAITAEVDPTVYLRFVTRSGFEPTTEDQL